MGTAREIEPQSGLAGARRGALQLAAPGARRWWGAAALALAAVPPLLYVRLIATTGENVLSNDQLLWVTLIDRMASGKYDFSGLLRDGFQSGTHEMAIPLLFTYLVARWFEWNVGLIQLCFVGVATLKVALLQRTIAGRSTHPAAVLLWPALSALVFAPAHVNVFTFSFAATHLGLAELGFVLGLYCLVRHERWPSVAGACLGGLLASWSWGSGLAVWPVFVLVAALRPAAGSRPWARLAALAGLGSAAAAAAAPYALYFRPGVGPHKVPSSAPAELLRRLVEGVGWPWCDVWTNHDRALVVGALGLQLLAAAVVALWPHRREVERWLPGAALVAFGAPLVLVTAALREKLAPWYTTSFGFLWIGLLALAYAAWTMPGARPAVRSFGGVVAVALAVLLASAGGFGTKVFYMRSMGPAAAACLREWRTAPTTCELLLFQWAPGNPENIGRLAGPMERHRWGLFGKKQQWSLQGDAFIGRVESDAPRTDPVRWQREGVAGFLPVADYRRLDARVPAARRVTWRVQLPDAVTRAELRTQVSFSGSAAGARVSAGGRSQSVEARPGGRWADLALPLGPGQTSIVFEVIGEQGRGHARFRFPAIDVEVGSGWVPQAGERWLRSEGDFVFDLQDAKLWQTHDLAPIGGWGEGRWRVGADPWLAFRGPLDLRLGDFGRLAVTASASNRVGPRVLQVFFKTSGRTNFREELSVRLPLYSGAARTYDFDLNVLGLPPDTRLSGLRVDPLDRPPAGEPTWVQLADVRLLRRERPQGLRPGSPDDLVLDLRDRAAWSLSPGIAPVSWWEAGRFWVWYDPYLTWARPLDAPIADYPVLSVTAAVSRSAVNRTLTVYYRTRTQPAFSEGQMIKIPLAEGPERTYQVELAAVGLPAGDRLTGLRVDPVEQTLPGPAVWVKLSDVRLLRRR